MHARSAATRRVDFQMVGRSDQHGGRSETLSRAAIVRESSREGNLVGVHEISE